MYRKQKKYFTNYLVKLKYSLGYFGDNSNLHGVARVVSLTPIPFFKRIFWLLILTASIVCSASILLKVLELYSGGAVSYFIETDFLEWDTPFPAVTICEQSTSTASPDRIKAYMQLHKLPSSQSAFLKDVAYWNPKFCKTCVTCKPNQTCIEDFGVAVQGIRAKCKELLTNCWWAGKPFSCCERFLPIETEYGMCFVFNSRLTGNESSLIVNRKIGLPYLIFLAAEEVGIRIHSPDDMVSVGMENILLQHGRPVVLPLITDFQVILKAEETVSDQSVMSMPPRMRGCLFKDERPEFATEWPSNRYSFNTCLLYCRVLSQLSVCNCSHHLMPKMGDVPLCNIQGLACLHKNKDSLGTVSCDCPMSCDEVAYKPVHMFINRTQTKPPPELAKRGTQAIVKFAQLPNTRVQRTAIRHVLGLVVDIGGVGGVFFGASLLSVIEIIYLCCIRRQK